MLVDTHCHLTYPELRPRIADVLQAACAAGVTRCVTVATQPDDGRAACELTRAFGAVYMAAGIHPHEAGKADDAMLADLRGLHEGRWSDGPRGGALVAVGETGLDFHYDFAPPDVQERVFRAQLALACDVGRPVVIHARQSEARVADILDAYPGLRGRVVFHCFSGTEEQARRVLDGGHWLSFTGVATFRNGDAIRAAARLTPADRIMVETDAPFLTPEPHRKVRPNEPKFVAETARRLAAERGESFEAFAALTTANAERFFGLGAA